MIAELDGEGDNLRDFWNHELPAVSPGLAQGFETPGLIEQERQCQAAARMASDT